MIVCLICFLSGVYGTAAAAAGIAEDDAFEGAKWEKIIEDEIEGEQGVVQSMCATEHYIVCMENTGDNTDAPDVIKAYYRNTVDENGNPVEQYSLAKRVAEQNYEHANGMAYNPNTGEIAVALYTSNDEQNRGCIYLMDAQTFTYKGKVQISDQYNILGIDYDEEYDRYVIQTNIEGGYSFKILDNQFQVTEDLGEYLGTAKGDNFQDLCVSGDYIINFPLTLFMGIGDYINMYSISQRALVSDSRLDFGFEGVVHDEPEGICELEPGVFAAAVNVVYEDGRKTVCIYKTMVPYDIPMSIMQDEERSNANDAAGESTNTGNVSEKNANTDSVPEGNTNIDSAAEKKTNIGSAALGKTIPVVAAAIVILGMTFGIYVQILHVRRERARKLRRARRERERIRRMVEE